MILYDRSVSEKIFGMERRMYSINYSCIFPNPVSNNELLGSNWQAAKMLS